MKNLENVRKLFEDKESIKVVSSVSKDGEIHSIVAGSVMVIDEDTMAVAEIFMNTTRTNLEETNTVSLLCAKGTESYLIAGTVQKRHTDGELFESVYKSFEALNLQIKALWTFSVDKIYDESAAPDAGKQIF